MDGMTSNYKQDKIKQHTLWDTLWLILDTE